ncbi:hypothetical protein HCC61_26930 [Streptomyces sp. HNM0575]|uniref:hypothetical protein n=1 Tax=Streptomyces sp. HNM0575 TaxID=2716338 RepID=UPI00145CE9C3|nr:hypothetical protein [Streptomyces sp. HNM0575]NLU76231.1 hypothetical protein [Streptomyces sp. HNM0575]
MATVITAASIAVPQSAGVPATSVRLAGQAARDALAGAGLSPGSVGVLINAGVYRESNTFEPALAAMVQKEAGINLDYLADPLPSAGFSFDLMNGACGVLNAVQLAQSLLSNGSTDRVLVTAADVHPGGRAADDPAYPYADLGGALLLESSVEPDAGFGPVHLRSGPGPTGTTGYLDTGGMGTGGRRMITVEQDTDRAVRLLDLAAATAGEYAEEHGLDLARTMVVCSRPAPDFAERLAARLGADPASVLAPAAPGSGPDGPDGPDGSGEPHTAAPVLGYLSALESGLLDGYEQLLFVAAGAGPSAACVSYRPQGR